MGLKKYFSLNSQATASYGIIITEGGSREACCSTGSCWDNNADAKADANAENAILLIMILHWCWWRDATFPSASCHCRH